MRIDLTSAPTRALPPPPSPPHTRHSHTHARSLPQAQQRFRERQRQAAKCAEEQWQAMADEMDKLQDENEVLEERCACVCGGGGGGGAARAWAQR